MKTDSRYILAHHDKYTLIQFTLLLKDTFMVHQEIRRQYTVHTVTPQRLPCICLATTRKPLIKSHVLDHQSTKGDHIIVRRSPSNTAQQFVWITWFTKDKILASSINKFQMQLQ